MLLFVRGIYLCNAVAVAFVVLSVAVVLTIAVSLVQFFAVLW